MSQSTPSRRAREERYVPFNPDPRNYGSRTGIAMPTNVPLNSDGFEDQDEFLRSPATDMGGDMTLASIFPKTPGGASSVGGATPGTGHTRGHRTPGGRAAETPGTGRRVRGRLSDLDVGEDVGGEEMLHDEDDFRAATPGQFFPSSEPRSVSLPSRSRLPPDSPSFNTSFDAIPSPSRTRPSPRKSHLTAAHRWSPEANTPRKVVRRDEDENGRVAEASKKKKGKSRVAAHLSPGEDEEQDEQDSTPRANAKSSHSQSQSTKSKHRPTARTPSQSPSASPNGSPGSELEQTFEDPDMSGFGNDDTVGSFDVDMDDAPMALMDDYDVAAVDAEFDDGGPGGYDDDDDVGLEQGAMDDEERSREGTEESENVPLPTKKAAAAARKQPAKKPVKKAEKEKRTAPGTPRARSRTREGSQPVRTRLSEIGRLNTDEDENGFRGNFKTRRSGRQHYRPLDWWRGEKVEYTRGQKLAVIKEIITIPEDKPEPLAARGKKKGRSISVAEGKREGKGGKKRDREEEEEDEKGWDDNTEPLGLVLDMDGEECHRKIACPAGLIVPKLVRTGGFKYQKVFGEGQFLASGAVHIPIGQKKTTKPSKDNVYVFFVWEGAVQVTAYRTSFVMAPGAQFLIPRGNDYCIENISPNKEAKLFFVQAREVLKGEQGVPASESQGGAVGVGVAGAGAVGRGLSASVGPSAKRGKKVVREESEEGSGSGSGSGSDEEEPVPKKKKAKGKR